MTNNHSDYRARDKKPFHEESGNFEDVVSLGQPAGTESPPAGALADGFQFNQAGAVDASEAFVNTLCAFLEYRKTVEDLIFYARALHLDIGGAAILSADEREYIRLLIRDGQPIRAALKRGSVRKLFKRAFGSVKQFEDALDCLASVIGGHQ